MPEIPPQVVQALVDAGVSHADVLAAWASLSTRAKHGLGLARRLLEQGAADPAQLERALGVPAPQDPPQPRSFAGYTVVRPLGRGAMGQVSLVLDAEGQSFALKTLSTVDDPVLIERFLREIRVMVALDHPHLARIRDAGVLGNTPYLVMDHYPNGSLAAHVAQGPLEPERATQIAAKLASALGFMHEHDLIHRDVKPDNVLFDEHGEPQLADFGLATAGERSLGRGRLTLSAEVLGTPAYMAPEQALDAKDVGPTADLYALGGVLYTMLTGRPPFADKGGLIAVLQAAINSPPTPPNVLAPGIPAALNAACLRALAKAPADRPQSAAAFLAELRASREGARISGWAWGLVGATALAVVGAGLALAFNRPQDANASGAQSPRVSEKVSPQRLARCGLRGAAWAAWALEARDEGWLQRGEALLVAGATPSTAELTSLGLDSATHAEWLIYLAARETALPKPLPQAGGRLVRWVELVVAAQRLSFAPGELRSSYVKLDPLAETKDQVASRIEGECDALLSGLERELSGFDSESPVHRALLATVVQPLVEVSIYRLRRLDGDKRIAFAKPAPLKAILALEQRMPEGIARDALHVLRIAEAFLSKRETDAARAKGSPSLLSELPSLGFERLRATSVQIRIWTTWWWLESELYGGRPPVAELTEELDALIADMESSSWRRAGPDGRRYLDEDEVYRRGSLLLLAARYPRTQVEPWPRFTRELALAERTCGVNPGYLDRIAYGNACLLTGDLAQAEALLALLEQKEPTHERGLLAAAWALESARTTETPAQREEFLARARRELTQFPQAKWPRLYWVAWLHVLAFGEPDEAEIAAAEAGWERAGPMRGGPAHYRVFDPKRFHFLPNRGVPLLPLRPLSK